MGFDRRFEIRLFARRRRGSSGWNGDGKRADSDRRACYRSH
jgi:hypothetical protein